MAKTKTAPKAKAAAKTTTVRSRAKPNAMELWTNTGPLAEAMRAGGFKITPEAFAAASMDTCLQDDGVEVRIVDGARVYSDLGKEFATLALDGTTLILRFAAPKKKDDLARVERFYRPVAGRPGWLEFRRPATRDPRPNLEAAVGTLLGQAAFDRNTGRRG
jgi:hypothetical protein